MDSDGVSGEAVKRRLDHRLEQDNRVVEPELLVGLEDARQVVELGFDPDRAPQCGWVATFCGERLICGPGGVGKTTLAAVAAEEASRRGLAVYWIRYRTVTDLAGKVIEAAVALGLPPGRVAAAQQSGASLSDLAWRYL